jgi:hypothetical protein
MVRLRARPPGQGVPDWVLTFVPTADLPTPIDWYRAVRDYSIESGLIEQDLDTWLYVLSSARQLVNAGWARNPNRPDMTSAIRTETDFEKEPDDGR